jgi:hypothetical protein
MLQAAGKKRACETLEKFAKEDKHNNQVIVLCRMLFIPKSKGDFRRPRIGAAEFMGETDYPDWPVEPIDLVDGVPFLITIGYRGSGIPESGKSYLSYCIKNCDWSLHPFTPKSSAENKKSLEKLLASPKWNAELCEAEKMFLASQIE